MQYFNDVRPLESEILRRFASCGQSIISKLEMKLRMLGNFVILVYLISLLACFTFFTINVSF